MRLKNPRSLLVFYAFVQVTWAYHHTKYADNIKNSQRTNPKKYHPSSVNVNHDPHQLRDRKLSSVPTSSTLLKNSDRTSKINNNKLRYSSSGHPVRHRHGWMMGTTTTTTTTTPSPEEELFNNYGDFYDGDYLTVRSTWRYLVTWPLNRKFDCIHVTTNFWFNSSCKTTE